MPIVAKSVLDARRAARTSAPPAVAIPPVTPPTLAAAATTVPPVSKRRGHATKGENDKWQPTGDYEVGFGRPPEATRFKKGGKAGPGRPKGSVSHDTLLKRQLDQKQRVRINGREKNVTVRELIATKTVMAAVDGKDRDARKYILSQSERLYVDTEGRSGTVSHFAELNASDALSVAEFMADLRRDLRAEIEAELAGRMGRNGS